MLELERLKLALDIHGRSYRLLKWIGDAIDGGVFDVPRMASGSEDRTSHFLHWLQRFRRNLPPATWPDDGSLPEFAAFFTTYLTTSFDIVINPGQIMKSSCGATANSAVGWKMRRTCRSRKSPHATSAAPPC